MAYCKNCGKEVFDSNAVCPHCGAAPEMKPAVTVTDKGGFWWGLLGCCIPIVGLILFLVWRDTKPKTSKAAGIGALVGAVCIVLFYILLFVAGIGLSVFYESYPYTYY